MKARNIIIGIALGIAIGIAPQFYVQKAPVQEISAVEFVEIDHIVDLANMVRAEHGCETPLVVNVDLQEASKERVLWVSDGNWSHDGVWETVKKHYDYKVAGENLARDFDSDEAMIEAWMESPLHRKNLLNCNFTETGVSRNGDYVVHLFGKK